MSHQDQSMAGNFQPLNTYEQSNQHFQQNQQQQYMEVQQPQQQQQGSGIQCIENQLNDYKRDHFCNNPKGKMNTSQPIKPNNSENQDNQPLMEDEEQDKMYYNQQQNSDFKMDSYQMGHNDSNIPYQQSGCYQAGNIGSEMSMEGNSYVQKSALESKFKAMQIGGQENDKINSYYYDEENDIDNLDLNSMALKLNK